MELAKCAVRGERKRRGGVVGARLFVERYSCNILLYQLPRMDASMIISSTPSLFIRYIK